jgi:hypothetical protein
MGANQAEQRVGDVRRKARWPRLLRIGISLVVLGGSVSLLAATPASATSPTTAANFVSQQGDYIGQGLNYAFPTVTASGQSNGIVTFDVSNSLDSFDVSLAAPTGQTLTAGTYPEAQRADVRSPGFAGLDVNGDSRGCNQVFGSFTVYDATYDSGGNVVSFAAQFFFHCEGFYAALMGQISYNSSASMPPLPATAPEPPQSALFVGGGVDSVGQGPSAAFSIASPQLVGAPQGIYAANEWDVSNESGATDALVFVAGPNNDPLQLGTYANSSRFFSASSPQLDIFGDGRGCNEETGTFTVYDIGYDTLGSLSSFAMEFTAYCDNDRTPLSGAIRWNSSVTMPPLPASPSSLDFGPTTVGDVSPTQTVALANDGTTSEPVSRVAITGPGADDFVITTGCSSIPAGGTCDMAVAFLPGAVGVRQATLTAAVGSFPATQISLTGTGTDGYYEATANGSVHPFGDAQFYGDMSHTRLSAPIVSMATTPDGAGYWLLGQDGGIFSFGDADFFGSTGNIRLNRPVLAMAPTPDGGGYWLVASDGGIFSFGDAPFYGSTGAMHLNRPVVGMAATPDGGGYWLVASDGGIFSFGDAQFYGSTGAIHLNKPIVGMASTPTGHGYWLVASDGGIFSFGDAQFYGSTGAIHLNKPIVGMAPTPTGHGYWLVASDGGLFSFGDASFYGSEGGSGSSDTVVMAGTAPPSVQAIFGIPAVRSRHVK